MQRLPIGPSGWGAALLALTLSVVAAAETVQPLHPRTYLQISPDGRDDLEMLFETLEASVAAGETQDQPVIIVLHGPEAEAFVKPNYLSNQSIVDRAAKLQAFGRIELRMCETWMQRRGFDPEDLLPFVAPVPYAPAEVEQLERNGYLPYAPDERGSELL
jgi:intracellular sulfur oxidation DsrE/DsrF family protein